MSLCMLFLAALTLAEAEVIETASPDTLVQAKTPDTPSGDGVTTELIEGPKDCEAHQRAVKSKLVTVHYVGSIYRGEMIPKRKFASSKDVGAASVCGHRSPFCRCFSTFYRHLQAV